jgi:hypothetical protein
MASLSVNADFFGLDLFLFNLHQPSQSNNIKENAL